MSLSPKYRCWSPKNTLPEQDNTPSNYRQWNTPLCVLYLSHNNKPKTPHTTKSRKTWNHHPIDDNITTIKDNNKKKYWQRIITVCFVTVCYRFFKNYHRPVFKFWSVQVPVRKGVRILKLENTISQKTTKHIYMK